jgi:hypothetical protein
MKRWILFALVACQSKPTPDLSAPPPAPLAQIAPADAGPLNPCEMMMRVTRRLGTCAKLAPPLREAFEKTAVQLQSSLANGAAFDARMWPVCQSVLKSFRDVSKDACPELVEAVAEDPNTVP